MILVTGATGFLGAELIHQLTRQGMQVTAIKRENSVIPAQLQGNTKITWVIADINDLATLEDAFEGITQVYHCAALVSFNPKDKAELLRVNIEGTSNIVHLCLDLHIKLLYVSSVAALGLAKKGKEICEEDFWVYDANVHSYAISKYEGEMEVWRGISEGLNAIIVNPSIIIGANAGFKGSGAIFELIKKGLSYYTSGSTGFVDVQDVASAMVKLMARDIKPANGESGERFIISAENCSYKDFFTAIAEGFKVKAPSKMATPLMLGIAWRAAKFASLFTGKPAGLTHETAKSSFNNSIYSNEKIKKTIGMEFKPLAVSIAEVCAALALKV
ncbi:NAD-dependent epimerase/dehydratase family protein [Pedobacter sp.]|uniref:NAD-dependent epimerase/dehydratase family protein n=1 Tax=Pedobacter sp. TaxID=1411316 RepID=UPI003D7F68EB